MTALARAPVATPAGDSDVDVVRAPRTCGQRLSEIGINEALAPNGV
ncbi:hypothetical protein [Actinomyces ruminicola]|nr:hypothetical protein [Actinomyces ruminicola]